MIKANTRPFWKTTLALIIGSIVVFGNVYVTQPILPVLTEEFKISPLMASMSVSLVILTLGLSLIFYGPLSDSVGRRGIMYVSMFIASVLTILMAYVTEYEWLLLLRMLQGLCLAGIPSIAMAYIGEEYEKSAIPLAIGLYISGNTIGGMGGRVLSGFLTDLYSWRVALIVLGGISFVCFILFVVLLKPSENFVAKKLDWKMATRDYKSHIKNKTLLFAFIIGGLHFLIFVGQFNYLTYFLSAEPYSLSTTVIGLLFLTYFAGTISSSLAGKLSNNLPLSTCIGLGIIIMFLGLILTLFQQLALIIIGVLIFCFGFFLAHSISASWVSKYANYAKASASGLYLITYYIGGSIGPFYLDPYWSGLGWSGIVVGATVILCMTTFLTLQLREIEKPVFHFQEKKSTS